MAPLDTLRGQMSDKMIPKWSKMEPKCVPTGVKWSLNGAQMEQNGALWWARCQNGATMMPSQHFSIVQHPVFNGVHYVRSLLIVDRKS